MEPTFCMYKDPYFQERSHIGRITVQKVDRSFQKNRWELDAVQTYGQTVWDIKLKYRNADNFFIGLFQWLSAPPVFCLTYGEVPSGYEEKVKAVPSRTGGTLYSLGGCRVLFETNRTSEIYYSFEWDRCPRPTGISLGGPLYVGRYFPSDAPSSNSRLKDFLGNDRQVQMESESLI